MFAARAQSFTLLTFLMGALVAMFAAGCGDDRGATPADVCDWMEECSGPQQPGCEKSLVPIYQQASDAGCSAELSEQFECVIEQDCTFDGDECLEESEDFNECIGAVPF